MSWLYPTEVVLPRKMSSVEMESLKSLRAFLEIDNYAKQEHLEEICILGMDPEQRLRFGSVFQHIVI